MLRFSLYFLVSLVLHAMASLFLRESVVEAGRAREMAQQPPAVMLIQLPPAAAPAEVAEAVVVKPIKPVVAPIAPLTPPVTKSVLVARKVEPQPVAKVQPQKAAPSKPVERKAVIGSQVLASAAPSVAPVAPAAPPQVKEVFSRSPSFLRPPAAPRYPSLAKRRNQQGVVLLEVCLDEHGRQLALQVVRSSGVQSLDEAALEAVAAWQFRPETEDGRAVPSRVQIPIEFALTASR